MAIRYPSKDDDDKKRQALAQWVEDQRESYRHGTLSQEQINKLERIPGWTWVSTGDAQDDQVDQ